MDPHARCLWRDVELPPDVLIRLVGQDAKLDRPTLAVGQVRESGAEVLIEAIEPGRVDGRGAGRKFELEPLTRGPLDRPASNRAGQDMPGDPEQPGREVPSSWST